MAQLEYRNAGELPAALRKTVFRDHEEQRWRVTALVIRRDPVSDKEIGRTAFLRRADSSGGREWEIALDALYETTEVDR
ncbi:hypothetical protein ACIGD1_34655 [Streptomyces sp. NPDC085612]|uniref:hypothetical protein n=1 Tax=Streptomyces sp. NPDC085612 TaxID=3365732 RepID=UPI0037D0F8D1